MGVFDLRCALSGLSTSGPHADGVKCSMLLLEEIEGILVPVVLPTSGTYDCYGRIELLGLDEQRMEHAAWIGAVFELLWESGTLRSTQPLPDDDLGGPAATTLALAADSVFNEFSITLDGHRIVPCLYRDDVADAIAESPESDPSPGEDVLVDALDDDDAVTVYGDWLEQHGRPLQAAYVRRHQARVRAGLCDAPPAATREVEDRFRRVLRYVEAHGRLHPITFDYADQHGEADCTRFADEVTDPIVREMIERWNEADAMLRERNLPFHEQAVERAAAARPVTTAIVATVLARVHPPSIVEPIVAALDRSPQRDRALEILRAPRATNPALVSDIDGIVAITADAVTVTSVEYPDYAKRMVRDDRPIVVANGASIAAGDRITPGELDLHDIVRIFGPKRAAESLIEQLAPLVDLDAANLRTLVEPMFSHLALIQTRQRVTSDEFGRWVDAGEYSIHADSLVTSYATLADHRDPSLADVRARITE